MLLYLAYTWAINQIGWRTKFLFEDYSPIELKLVLRLCVKKKTRLHSWYVQQVVMEKVHLDIQPLVL